MPATVWRWRTQVRLNSMNDTLRVHFGTDIHNGGVNRESSVFATVTEMAKAPDIPSLGNAMLAVNNVTPHDDGTVTMVIRERELFHGIDIRIDFLVSNSDVRFARGEDLTK